LDQGLTHGGAVLMENNHFLDHPTVGEREHQVVHRRGRRSLYRFQVNKKYSIRRAVLISGLHLNRCRVPDVSA
jgi:hypothetical protein